MDHFTRLVKKCKKKIYSQDVEQTTRIIAPIVVGALPVTAVTSVATTAAWVIVKPALIHLFLPIAKYAAVRIILDYYVFN